MLYGKNVIVGISGGIAVYKICEVVSRLKKLGAEVDVIMTAHAAEFVTPLTFETLSKNKVTTDMFDRNFDYDVTHISLAKKASLFVVAPATANIIGKLAHGIADDMLTTTWLACKAPKLIAPAMNTAMYEDNVFETNLASLREAGVNVVEPDEGMLACGDSGNGRLAEPEAIVAEIERLLQPKCDLKGKRVLVTAGATEEPIDAVRFVTNRSSGKMGCALAAAAAERGAEVVLVHGIMTAEIPPSVASRVAVSTTAQMYDAVTAQSKSADIVVMAAAPADYRPDKVSEQKIKGGELTLHFVKNPDIAAAVGKNKGKTRLVVFSAETENLIENARGKLIAKNADLVVANDVTAEGAGFGVDTNVATLIDRSGNMVECGLMSKLELADAIFDRLATI